MQMITRIFKRIQPEILDDAPYKDEGHHDEHGACLSVFCSPSSLMLPSDEGQLLLLITQIKHLMSHIQSLIQLLSDVYERNQDKAHRTTIVRGVRQVAEELQSLVAP